MEIHDLICESKKICVLVVDDDESFLKLLETVIDSIPFYEVVGVSSVDDAILVFAPDKFSIIIIDLLLDSSTSASIQFAKHIRQRDQNVIIVICTGYSSVLVDSDKELMESVDYFLEKPFDYTFLRSRLFSWGFHYRDRRECNLRFDTLSKNVLERLDRLDLLSMQISEVIKK